MHLVQIPVILEDNFKSGWLANLKFSNESEIEQTLLGIIERFTLVTEKIVVGLHLSVLSGEYVNEEKESFINLINTAKDKLTNQSTDLQEQISTISDTIIPKNEKLESVFLNISNTFDFAFKSNVMSSLDDYERFIIKYHQKLTGGNNKILFQALKVKKNNDNYKTIVSLSSMFEVFSYNIQLAEIDQNLCIDNDSSFLEDLLLTKEVILEIIDKKKYPEKLQQIYLILQDKCNFLTKKIVEEYDDNVYIINTNIRNVIDPKTEIQFFNHFDNFQEIAYESTNQFRDLIREADKVILKKHRGITLTFSDYFILVKYHKEISKCPNEIGYLINDFEKFELDLKSTFNIKAFQISLNYLKNNQYSLFLKDAHLDAATVYKKFTELKGLQFTTTNKNYFPYLKFAEWCCNYLTEAFQEDRLEDIELVTNLLEENVKALKDNFNWCKQNSFLPFQLPFSESQITPNVNPLNIKIFVASSFVRPVNYDKVEAVIVQIEAKLINFKNLSQNLEILTAKIVKIGLELRTAKDEIKGNIKDAKDEAKEAQKNNLQILSIFAAIVVFATGNIQIFKSATNYKQAMIFMLVFGYCLCLFVLLIWFISYYKKDNTKKLLPEIKDNIPNTHRMILGSLFIGLAANFFFLFTSFGNEKIENIIVQQATPNTRQKSDVAVKNVSLDSLPKKNLPYKKTHFKTISTKR